MSVRIVRLGSDRGPDEGPRIGTVRRPPRGVPKSEFARQNWYDLWYPDLAPTVETMKLGRAAASDAEWRKFERLYRREMSGAGPRRTIELLALLSQHSNFSVGCYCEDEARCHRSILRELLVASGAELGRP